MKCPKCHGCGQIADTDREEPWADWLALPMQSAAAVLLGVIKPRACPRCAGSGEIEDPFIDTRPLIPLRCILCDADAVVVIYAPHGCTCATNRVQPRCRQHLGRADDSEETFEILEDLQPDGDSEWRVTTKAFLGGDAQHTERSHD